MICCLNPECHNPPVPDNTKFCPHCGVPLFILRNRYRPIKSLGDGGFSKTYLAEDIDTFNDKCVIKQFVPQTQGTGALQKATELFEQEAKQLQKLGKHPQIPTLLAYFTENNRLYLIQEFIDGQNLYTELKQRGKFNEQKIRELLLDILPILQIVHQEKIIHRDIKPENIMRRRSDGKLFLIDFGASKQVQGTIKTGTKIGSFGYASLEQMEDREVYPASDLYSIGATCFHLLTSIHPWDLWKEDGYSWVKQWQKYLQQPISFEFRQILDKLLRKEYQQRYQSAEEVLQVLKPPVKPPKLPTPQTQTLPNWQTPINLTIVLTLILLSGLVGFLFKLNTETKTPSKPIVIETTTPSQPVVIETNIPSEPIVIETNIPPEPVVIETNTPSLPVTQPTPEVIQPITEVTQPTTEVTPKNITTATLINSLTGHSGNVNTLAISPDGSTLFSGGDDKTITIWNLATGELKSTLNGHSGKVLSIAISHDGKTLVSGSDDKTITIWNLATGELKSTLNGHSHSIRSLIISLDGKTLASASGDNTIKIWNLVTGEFKSTLVGHSNSISCLAISRNGKTLVSGSHDNTIKIWNLATGEFKSTLVGHSSWVFSLDISPDGKTLASASDDRTIKIWNLVTGELKSTLTGHTGKVGFLAISSDGKTLVSASDDQTLKIWNLVTGELKSTLTNPSDWLGLLAISPDGKTLISVFSGSYDNTIRIWRLD